MLFVIALVVVVPRAKNRVWGWVSGSLICGSYDIRLFSQIIVNYLWFLRTSLPSPHFPSGVFPFCLLNGLEFSWSSAASVRHISRGFWAWHDRDLRENRPESALSVISLKITPGTERNTFNDNSRARKVIILSEFSWGNWDDEPELVSTDWLTDWLQRAWRVLPTHNTLSD